MFHPARGCRGVSLLVLALCVAGCSSGNAAASRKLMQDPIAPASDALFNAVIYTNGQLVAAPRSDADWSRLDQRIAALAAAAGPLKALAPRSGNDAWLKQSDLYAEALSDARSAVARRNVDDVLAAGGKLYASCAGCHLEYIREK